VWLKHWSEINQRYGGNPSVGKYIGIYFAFGVGSAALVVVQTLILWIFCSIEVRIVPSDLCAQEHVLTAWCLGQPQITRADGVCHLPFSNELLRDHTCRTYLEQIFKVRPSPEYQDLPSRGPSHIHR